MLALAKWKGLEEDQEFKTSLGYIGSPHLQNQRNKQKEEFCRIPGNREDIRSCKDAAAKSSTSRSRAITISLERSTQRDQSLFPDTLPGPHSAAADTFAHCLSYAQQVPEGRLLVSWGTRLF